MPPPHINITVDGQPVEVPVVVHTRARRMILRLDPRTHMPRLTCPPRTPERALIRFLEDSRTWLAAEWLVRPPAKPLTAGDDVMLHGQPHRLIFDERARRGVRAEHGELVVGGPADMAAMRLAKYLKAEARKTLTPMVQGYAGALGARLAGVRFGDTVSRWGSCSAKAVVRLNWRLVMAPPAVQRYVAAHEAAHLREMNHSPKFWALVEELVGPWKAERKWLRSEAARRLMTLPIGRGSVSK